MFSGSITALVTPFDSSLQIDRDLFRLRVQHQAECKSDGVVIFGTTGEGATLSKEEKVMLMEDAVLASSGKIPVIANVGTNITAQSVELAKEASRIGCDGLLVIVPYYSRPSFAGIKEHFIQVAKVGLPVILYHHPGRCGKTLSFSELRELCEIPGVVGIKDASADFSLVSKLCALPDIAVFAADDTLVLPHYSLGAKGVISVCANLFPACWKELTLLCEKERFSEARELFAQVEPVIDAIFSEENPIGIKYALSVAEEIKGYYRLPLCPPSEKNQKAIKKQFDKVKNSYTRGPLCLK